jgi:cobalt-precorrin 5A hydrolase
MTRIFFTHSGKQKKADKAGNYVNKAAVFAFTENGKKLASKLLDGLHNYYKYRGSSNCESYCGDNCDGNYDSNNDGNYNSNNDGNYNGNNNSNNNDCNNYYDYEKRNKKIGGKVFRKQNTCNSDVFEFFNYDNCNYSKNIEHAFNEYDFLIFFLSLGAVIRLISPHIKSKLSDPGVIVIDEKGNYVISALSGHIGRANELCTAIAEITGAAPVITTATDISEKFSLDMFAKKFNLNIENKNCIKYINKSSLNAQKIIIFIPEFDPILGTNEDFKNEIKDYFADFTQPFQFICKKNDIEEILKAYYNKSIINKPIYNEENITPNSGYNLNSDNNPNSDNNKMIININNANYNNSASLNIIIISYKTDVLNLRMPDFVFDDFFSAKSHYNHNINICRLFPRNLSIGIGCNKNTTFEEIENFVQEIFNENNLSTLSIRNVSTIDIKSEEKGILEFAGKYAQYIDFFSKDEINNFWHKYKNKDDLNTDLKVDGFTNEHNAMSACFRYTGAYSVCEPCALLSSDTNKELLLCKKKKMNTTMAVAI